jgi:hypothetical protein
MIISYLELSYLQRNDSIFKKNINKIGFMKFFNNNKKTQIGGNNNYKKIKYGDNKYIFQELIENTWFLRSIDDNYDCVSISIDKENKTSIINNINADIAKCGLNILTNQGSHLVKLSIKFLKKYKKEFKINKILLKDNARKACYNEDGFYFSDFLLLVNGDTFYGKYGFKPISKNSKKYYYKSKKIMNNLYIKELDLEDFFNNKFKKKEEIKFQKLLLNNQNKLLKNVLSNFFRKEKYDKRCYMIPFIIRLFNIKISNLNYKFIWLNGEINYYLDL